MDHAVIFVGKNLGYVFKGMIPNTFTFVPQGCVNFDEQDEPALDDLAYMRSGWDVRNMRFNDSETSGSRLYPEVHDDLADLSDERVSRFVERLQHAFEERNA